MKFFYYVATCFDYRFYQTGSAVPSMTQFDLGNICMPVPLQEEQNEIVEYLDKKCTQIDAILEAKRKQLETITEHKKSLIYEYVTGKKRVKEVQ